MTKTALVLGASGSFGGQMALALEAAGWQVNRFRRGTDMAAAAKGARLIVNGLNPPNYHNWAKFVPEITAQVQSAGRASGATILLPGNVYPFGIEPAPWGPNTPHRPISRKGRVRAEMEASYRDAAAQGQRVLLLRAGDFLQPGAAQNMMNRMVLGKLMRGRITALGDPDARHAWAYLPDMARAAVGLVELGEALPGFADIPFPGHAFTLSELSAHLSRLLGKPLRVSRFPNWVFTLASPFWELARELREMLYLSSFAHELDPGPLQHWLPDFQPTDLDAVLLQLVAGLQGQSISTQTGK